MLREAIIISLFFLGAALVPGVAVTLAIPGHSLGNTYWVKRRQGSTYMWGGQKDKRELICVCPLFPKLGHLDRIPSSLAVVLSKWLQTSMYLPSHQPPGQPCLSSSEGPRLLMVKEDNCV